MGNQRQSPRSLVKSLRRKQVRHEILLEQVEKTSVRLERRKAKLLALEGKIADLERRVAEGPRTLQAAAGESLQRAVLIFNPSAGPDQKDSEARLTASVSALRAHGIEASVGLKTSGKALREQAREAVRSRVPWSSRRVATARSRPSPHSSSAAGRPWASFPWAL
jgi:septal ring factor EnvC (AmiA/AmiB activator)